MKQILKHSFEAVSLLTTNKGMLDVTIVPAFDQPDWIIPSSLILSVDEYSEHTWNYEWQQQEVAVFHMLPRHQTPDKMIVLEGNTSAHRIALQTAGELRQLQARISEVKDVELPEHFYKTDSNIDTVFERVQEDVVLSYLFQTVMIDNTLYLVPDLDKIAHQLIDLDS
ncbi:hypothetical protein [Psychrobacter sp. DAB_AL43B]|uniref:hypothetical protein n=1 Tax=Psychrobacter sp. DAB_AL43B TaxID=1028416 RepID=UPI0009A8E6FD|nr:hypothetical protein [Psychrobacter sp. DAB_AL43B]SLJ85578.1 hypothetical protein DABAL43B_2394 [Psychrobacter sp. DAB_AL43B]